MLAAPRASCASSATSATAASPPRSRTGFYGARNDFVTWIPADGQIPLVELAKILDAWRDHDLVLSTYRRRDDGLARTVLSRGLRLLLRVTTGLVDRLEGVYLFRRALLDELDLVAAQSAGAIGFEIAVKARRLGKRIGSTEIECAPRLSGQSKVANARNIAQSFAELWRIRRSLPGCAVRRAYHLHRTRGTPVPTRESSPQYVGANPAKL